MKIHAFGCSLTRQAGWANELRRLTGIPVVNHATGAGSNELQMAKFSQEFLNGNIHNDDVIIWQITSFGRVGAIGKLENKEAYIRESFIDILGENYYDNEARISILQKGDLCEPLETMRASHLQTHDSLHLAEQLTAHLLMIKKMNFRLLVIPGWSGIMHDSYENVEENFRKFCATLKQAEITYTVPLLDWVIENRLPVADTSHPTEKSYHEFTKKVIYPIWPLLIQPIQ